MPNIHLTAPMQTYVQGLIASGAYANLSEVVRAGLRLLMEKDGQRQFDAAKAERLRNAAEGLKAMMNTGTAVSDAEMKELREHGRR